MARSNKSTTHDFSEDLETEETQPLQSEAPAGNARKYASNQVLDHDLYKLEVADMFKDVSYTDRPTLVPVEHSHFFHSIDSTGKALTTCNQVGGHFHEMEIINVPGKAPEVRCGPAVRYVLKKVNGRLRKVTEQIKNDNHTHKVTYVSSEKISPRKMNNEYVKVQAILDAAAPKPVDGVVG